MLHSALPADTSASAFAVLTETLACSLIGEPRSTDVDIAIKVAERSDRRDLPFAYERLSRSHQLATEHGYAKVATGPQMHFKVCADKTPEQSRGVTSSA